MTSEGDPLDYEFKLLQNMRVMPDGLISRPGQAKKFTTNIGSVSGIYEASDVRAPGVIWPEYSPPGPPCFPSTCSQGPTSGENPTKFYYGGHTPFTMACPCTPAARSSLGYFDPVKTGSMNPGSGQFLIRDGIGVPGAQGCSQGRLVAFEGELYWITNTRFEGFAGCGQLGATAGIYLNKVPKAVGALAVAPVNLLTPVVAAYQNDALPINADIWFSFDDFLYGSFFGAGAPFGNINVWTYNSSTGFTHRSRSDSSNYPAGSGYIHGMLAEGVPGKVYLAYTGDHVNNIYNPSIVELGSGTVYPIDLPAFNFNVGSGKGGGIVGGVNYSFPPTLGPWGVQFGSHFYVAGNMPGTGAVIYKIDGSGAVTIARLIGMPAPIVDPLRCTVSNIFVHNGALYYVIHGSVFGVGSRMWLGKYNGAVWNDAHFTFPNGAPIPGQATTFNGEVLLLGTDLNAGAGPRGIKATNADLTAWAQWMPGAGGSTCTNSGANWGTEL
jgi:hypothetical protein